MTARGGGSSVTSEVPRADPAATRKPAAKRPKFDKAASTTVLLAALLGLGAGAGGRLLAAAPVVASTPRPAPVEPATPPAMVIVVDVNGRILATYDDARLAPLGRNDRARVTLTPGRSLTPAASTRAS